MLQDDVFLQIVRNAPLVSIDLVVRSSDNALLMGLRVNNPASGYWFVPGGRIKKDETLDEAFLRITEGELGKSISIKQARLIGIFTHKYSNNFTGTSEVGTHYIALAYELQISINIEKLPKEQHSEYKWVRTDDDSIQIHHNSKAYFAYLSKLSDAQYAILNTRRDAFNNLLWQAPALSLVAQAFLFTIILNSSSSITAVATSALLSVATSVASRQLLDKHRYGERECAILLQADEKIKGLYEINCHRKSGNKWIDFSSYRVWSYVLLFFGIAAMLAFIIKAIRL